MYDELVKRLRRCEQFRCRECEYEQVMGCRAKLNADAADAIAELQKAVNFHKFNSEFWEGKYNSLADEKWIPVTERLPKDDAVCIITNGVSNAIGYRGKVFGWHLIWTDYLEASEVTHWMPLPQPPKEG